MGLALLHFVAWLNLLHYDFVCPGKLVFFFSISLSTVLYYKCFKWQFIKEINLKRNYNMVRLKGSNSCLHHSKDNETLYLAFGVSLTRSFITLSFCDLRLHPKNNKSLILQRDEQMALLHKLSRIYSTFWYWRRVFRYPMKSLCTTNEPPSGERLRKLLIFKTNILLMQYR